MKALLTAFIATMISFVAYAQAPSWSVDPNNFTNSMTLVAVVEIDDVELSNTSDQLGAFVGMEVRGVANSILLSGRYYFFVTIYSDEVSDESISFKVYDASNDVTVDLANTIEFTLDLVSGAIGNPVLLTNDAGAVDDEGPVVTISTTESDPTNQSSFTVTFSFDEEVKSFAIEDIEVTNGSLSSFSGSDQTYSCTVTPTADGPVTLQLPADALTDVTGNENNASEQFSVLYYSDLIYTSTGWSNLGGPTETNNAVIAHDLSTSDLATDNLYVDTDILLMVEADGSMVVKGTLENNGSIYMNSGAALVNDTYFGAGDFTYSRNTTYDIGQGRYSFIGSPVAGHDLSITSGDFKFTYDEATDTYLDASDVTSMDVGVGYTIANNDQIDFSGVPNSGNIFVPVTHDGNGFNLVANPYPAAISYSDFMEANLYDAVDNTLGGITGTIYIWDDGDSGNKEPESTDFLTINEMGYVSGGNSRSANYQGYLPTAQGFIVEAVDGAGGAIVFQNDMKFNTNNGDSQFFRDTSEEDELKDQIKLVLTDQGALRSETLAGYRSDASAARDFRYDALKVSGNSALQLYTVGENQQSYAIQAIKEGAFTLGYTISEAGFYEFSAAEIHPDQSGDFLLTDQLTGFTVAIGERPYRFYATESSSDRFLLQMKQPVIDEGFSARHDFELKVTKDQIVINTLEEKGEQALQVMDLNGRVLINQMVRLVDGVGSVPATLSDNQIYMVRFGGHVTKVLIQ